MAEHSVPCPYCHKGHNITSQDGCDYDYARRCIYCQKLFVISVHHPAPVFTALKLSKTNLKEVP
jgi:hypothetical protein